MKRSLNTLVKVLALMLVVALVGGALAACSEPAATPSESGGTSSSGSSSSGGSTATAAPATQSGGEEKKGDDQFFVGISFNGLDVVPAIIKDTLEKLIDEKHPDWKYVITNGDLDANKQVADIENLILQEPDVILVRANSFARSTIYQSVYDAGIPLVAMSTGSRAGLTEEESKMMLTGIGESELVRGLPLGYWLADYMDANPDFVPKIGFVVGDAGIDSKLQCQRTYDFMRALQERGKEEGRDWHYVIRGEADPKWSTAGGMKVVEDWLQKYTIDELNTIFCWSDEMVVGVCQALQAAGKQPGEYIVMSFDGLDIIDEYIRGGWIQAVSAIDIPKQCDKILWVLEQIADGKKDTLAPIEFGESIYLLTPENYEQAKAGNYENFKYTADMEIEPVLKGSKYYPE